jgi:hypothetical protein
LFDHLSPLPCVAFNPFGDLNPNAGGACAFVSSPNPNSALAL